MPDRPVVALDIAVLLGLAGLGVGQGGAWTFPGSRICDLIAIRLLDVPDANASLLY